MEVLIILLISFGLNLIISKLIKNEWRFIFSGNLAMCLMLCFTAIGHIIYAEGMAMIIPQFIPYRLEIVYITGILEVMMGFFLLFPKYMYITGIIVMLFFTIILPCNIYQAINHINLARADYTGNGLGYLWFRIPLQIFLTGWVYYFAIITQRFSKA